jgi:hypothetical protein
MCHVGANMAVWVHGSMASSQNSAIEISLSGKAVSYKKLERLLQSYYRLIFSDRLSP